VLGGAAGTHFGGWEASGFWFIVYLIRFPQSCSIADRHTTLHKSLLKSHFSGLVSFIERLLKIIKRRKKKKPPAHINKWLFMCFSNKLNCYLYPEPPHTRCKDSQKKGAYTVLTLLL
jgi:hypothetical protein